MGVEIERKFLVINDSWKKYTTGYGLIHQAYIAAGPGGIVRVRTNDIYAVGTLTIKGPRVGLTCAEYEYEIPKEDAEAMMLSPMREGRVLQKFRHVCLFKDHVWEVDEFLWSLAGLTIAEIELGSEDERFEMPPLIGIEVSHDRSYTNVVLAGAME